MRSTKVRSASASPKALVKARSASAPTAPAGKRPKAASSLPKKVAKAPPKPASKASPKKGANASTRKAAKAGPKQAAKVSPKQVAKARPKTLAKAGPKQVAKAGPKQVAKAPVRLPVPPVSTKRAEPKPAHPPRPVEVRVPPTPLVKTAFSGVGSSGAAARRPADRELRPGDDLPSLSRRPVNRIDVARYCAASGDFNVIALDEPRARDAGLPGVVVPGGLAFALADACVAAWLGRDGRVCRMGARLVKMVWPDDALVARARVNDLREGASGREVDLDVWVENQKGELVLRGQAACVIRGAPGVS